MLWSRNANLIACALLFVFASIPFQEQHSFPIFDNEWGADEELLLIEGAENFGIGNWQDIADHVGSKSRDECEAHYLQVYVNSQTWPLPVSRRQSSVHTPVHNLIRRDF